MPMSLTARRLDAADLLEQGTYTLRRALDRLPRRPARFVAEQLAGHAQPRQRAGRPDDVAVAPGRSRRL